MNSTHFNVERSYNEDKKEVINDVIVGTNNHVNQQEDILFDFGMYSISDSLTSDGENIGSKDDRLCIDDLNGVNRNDLLFMNTDSYEDILSDFSSVSDSINLYNENDNLYGSDNNKELTFDCDALLADSNSYSTAGIHQSLDKCDISTHTATPELACVTENLENIVPNTNVCINSSLNCNSPSETNVSILPPLSEDKSILNSNVLCDKVLESECGNKETKIPVINVTPSEKFDLLEFLNFKGSKLILNNNDSFFDNNTNKLINGNAKIVNGLVNIPKENLRSVPLRHGKSMSPHILLSNQPNFSVPVKKFKNINGVATVKLFVKQTDINELRNKPLKLVNKNYTSNIINCNLDSRECVKNPSVLYLDKGIQTSVKTNEHKAVKEGNRNHFESKIEEKIKKPELLKNVYVFSFSLNVRKSIGSISIQEFYKDNDRIHYYTGIPKYSYFMALLNCLNLPTNENISPFQMLLSTLMKIRLNLDWMDLAYRFDKSIQIVKESFGITVFILLKCLSRLLHWPMQECQIGNYSRIGMNLYVCSIKLNINKKIFVCLSASRHPIHFVSNPIADSDYENRLEILACSGINDGLALRDVIIFDEEIDCLSSTGDRSALLVISKNCKSFCNKPYDDTICNVKQMKDTVNEIKKYKFINEEITCSWVNESNGSFTLFNDVVKVVCGLVNLCHVLPFCNVAVKDIISQRKNLDIVLT